MRSQGETSYNTEKLEVRILSREKHGGKRDRIDGEQVFRNFLSYGKTRSVQIETANLQAGF